MTVLTGYIKKSLQTSNKKPKINTMHNPNLANLTTQYQQTYLAYCYKIMQYLSLLAWTGQQQRSLQHKVKPKSASGVKKLASEVNQEKPTLKSLKHIEKSYVSTIVAMGFPNGAMSAAFRIAFNHALTPSTPNTKPGRFVCQSKCQWNTALEAHKAAAKAYYALSVADNKEYGWHVYEHSDGSFTYTYPTIGDEKVVAHAGLYTSKTGKYKFDSTGHTHVDGNSLFSGKDINYVTQRTKIKGDDRKLFLVAPDKHIYSLSSSRAISSSRATGSSLSTAYSRLPQRLAKDEGGY